MLGLAKRVRAKILQASTSEVYGDPAVHPQTEDYWGNVNPNGSDGAGASQRTGKPASPHPKPGPSSHQSEASHDASQGKQSR
jgi:hypothetical protein